MERVESAIYLWRAVSTTSQTSSDTTTATGSVATFPAAVTELDVSDRADRKLGSVFVRKPDDSVNLGDDVNPVRIDPTGQTLQPVYEWDSGQLTPVTFTLGSTSDTEVVGAPSAGQAIYVCSILATNASDVMTRLDLKDGAAGATRVSGQCAKNGLGFFWRPMRPWRLTAETGLYGALSEAGSTIVLTVEYFVGDA